MTVPEIDVPPEWRDDLEEVAQAVQSLFGVDRASAVQKMNEFWADHRLWELGVASMVGYEAPGYWAKVVWYGADSRWRRPELYESSEE